VGLEIVEVVVPVIVVEDQISEAEAVVRVMIVNVRMPDREVPEVVRRMIVSVASNVPNRVRSVHLQLKN